MDETLLIFHVRPARRRALAVARLEAVRLLADLRVAALPGGPFSEQGGIFWITLPSDAMEHAVARFPRLGYTCAVDSLAPVAQGRHAERRQQAFLSGTVVRWRGRLFRLTRRYDEDAEALREQAPDRRTFALETSSGAVRQIRGYRGSGGTLTRRGLSVADARLLVNLVTVPRGTFLDPFAGIGGIVLEALAAGQRVMSCDVDPALRHGLAQMGAMHGVADARALPYRRGTIDAVGTEPPYAAQADTVVNIALREIERVLRPGGRVAMLCAQRQAAELRQTAAALGLTSYLDAPLDRKGTQTVILAWQKARDPTPRL